MNTGQRPNAPAGRRHACVWLAAALTVLAAVSVAIVVSRPARVSLTASFTDAYPLVIGSRVKLAGVPVGEVSAIRLGSGQARVVMTLDPAVLPLHTDARAVITPSDLLGERFIDLHRGSPTAPALPNPGILRADQTNRIVDLQEVLNSMDNPTATALAGLVTTSGEGLRGNGAATDAAIADLSPSMARVHELVDVLDAQNARLNTLIDHAEPVADALSTQRGADLDNLVDSTTDTLGVLADRQHDLRGTLAQLPSTLSSARTTLGTVSAAAEPTTNVLRSVRPVTDALPRISDELRGFSSSADPALTALTPVLDRAKHLLDEARPVVDQLRQAGPPLAGTARSATSLTEQVLRPHFGDLMEFLKGWAMSTTDYDAISHYFTAMVPESPRAVGQQLTGPIPGAPHAPVQGVPLPAPPAPRYDRLGSMLAPGHSSTGLSEHQEHSMLDQLLGGS